MEGIRKLNFTKMHGAGNDYVYMDGFGDSPLRNLSEKNYPDLARKISNRHFGVGSDGLILILPSADADFYMRIFNADGSEAQMCGNGIRCVAKYAYEKGLTDKCRLQIDTLAGVKEISMEKEGDKIVGITVDMGAPILKRSIIPVKGEDNEPVVLQPLKIEDKVFKITAVGMGNPHCVIFVDKITDELVNHYGPLIERNEFFPEKTNVEFIETVNRESIKMRVWERGSGETLACGTGACAAVVASFLNGLTERETEVSLLGGKLKIRYDEISGHVFMTGEGETIADGCYYYQID